MDHLDGICSIQTTFGIKFKKSSWVQKKIPSSFLWLLLNSTQNILTFFVGGFHRSSQSSFEKPSSMATIWQFPAYWMMASLLHHHFKITPRTRPHNYSKRNELKKGGQTTQTTTDSLLLFSMGQMANNTDGHFKGIYPSWAPDWKIRILFYSNNAVQTHRFAPKNVSYSLV